MLKCECDRCHTEMKVPSVMMPFVMNPQESKPEFMIFKHDENDQMQQLHLCPTCERHFKSFLHELDKGTV